MLQIRTSQGMSGSYVPLISFYRNSSGSISVQPYTLGAVGGLEVRASNSGPECLVPCLNCGSGDRWSRHLSYLPFGEFRQANSHCCLYGAQGQGQAYF
ncbi:hypothetical protein TNCV_4377411 [Trichonephila clavipes]|nr:hypothetical protein TNCV_4377411 [Trichonephila clavipes]